MELSDQRSPTSILVAGVCLLVPLLILPASVSFSFDSLPKAVYLLLSAAIFLLLPGGFARSVGNLFSTTAGKLFLIFAAIGAISVIVSSIFSVDPQLSFFGTRWRYFGASSQLAALAMGIAAAGCFIARRAALFFSLRMISLAGLLAAVYALFQFFGFDPLLAPGLYTLTFNITRPPSSLGHPGYLAGFETIVFFVALAARQAERRRLWRLGLAACAGFALIAIFVSGTRAAVLAVVLCFPIFFAIRKVRGLHGWAPWVLLLLSVVVFGLLALTPPGRGLRQRVRQATQDFGGPRLRVWKDTLGLLQTRALTGSGPETFTVVFPRVESRELYLRYPDYQQESPHNVFLDAAVAQGIPGLLELLFAATLAGWCAWKTEEANRDVAYILGAGVAACLIFHQFFAFTLPTYCGFLLLLSALVALGAPLNLKRLELPRGGRVTLALSGALLAMVLLATAAQLSLTDYAFARIDSLLKRGNLAGAVEQYHFARRWKFFGDSPDLWYSQQMAWAVGAVPAGELQQLARDEAMEASRIAFENPGEDRVTAAYHRAILCASSGQQQEAETAARRLRLEAPNWYQPHWILSRLLVGRGHLEEGQRETEQALALVGDNKAELREQMKLYQQVVLLAQKKRP
ncbi:MAG TPA: O-antigen ligase family protein [Bryobacteraceae bacterium]|nr:O-antigen ligase family protein [Bryobacteraceae bacterium]